MPWWGMLIEGDLRDVRPLVEIAMRVAGPSYTANDVAFVAGNGWTGAFFFVRDVPSYALADGVRLLGDRRVVILDLGDVPWVRRWDGMQWQHAERETRQAADAVGIRIPGFGLGRTTRPYRYAAVVEGLSTDELRAMVKQPQQVIEGHRGPILLCRDAALEDLEESPRYTLYVVTHYIDNDDFGCDVIHGGDVKVFPGTRAMGLPSIDSVLGETDPRAIVRALGIPEDHVFPPSEH